LLFMILYNPILLVIGLAVVFLSLTSSVFVCFIFRHVSRLKAFHHCRPGWILLLFFVASRYSSSYCPDTRH
jgi:hypothetical protein